MEKESLKLISSMASYFLPVLSNGKPSLTVVLVVLLVARRSHDGRTVGEKVLEGLGASGHKGLQVQRTVFQSGGDGLIQGRWRHLGVVGSVHNDEGEANGVLQTEAPRRGVQRNAAGLILMADATVPINTGAVSD